MNDAPAQASVEAGKCPSCDGTGLDLYDGTSHDCQVCNGRGTLSPPPTVGAEDEAVPYAHEFGRSNGDGTFSVVIERGEPKRANDQWPVRALYTRPSPSAVEAVNELDAFYQGWLTRWREKVSCIASEKGEV